MAGQDFIEAGYRLGPRVPSSLKATGVVGRNDVSKIQQRADSTGSNCAKDSNLCEKPEGGSSMALPIALGVAIPLVVIAFVLLYLHRRNVKKVREEDTLDPHKSLDFGLAMDPTKAKAKAKRKSSFFGGEKDMFSSKPRQLSLDMGLSSPYLLPPEVHSSRESLHSLARTLHQNEDPYRSVAQYANSDVGSLRSFQREARDGGSSIHTHSTDGAGSVKGARLPPRNSNHLSVTTSPARSRSPNALPNPDNNGRLSPAIPAFPAPVKEPPSGLAVSAERGPDASASQQPMADVQVPERTASKMAQEGVSSVPGPPNQTGDTGYEMPVDAGFDLGLNGPPAELDHNPTLPKLEVSGSFDDEMFLPGQASTVDEPVMHSVSHPGEAADNYEQEEGRGGDLHRRSSFYDQDNNGPRQSTLGLPQMEAKRMSVGFRPLPPDEVMESEDPETRANRIRSFYKEYFDESRPDMAEYNQHYPPNAALNQRNAAAGRSQQDGQYYEDYDEAYIDEASNAPYFDPQSNAFVMPYAQPVSRRAMTPPPSGSRFPGPRGRGGPRNFHGSVGGLGLSGRPGSAASSRMGPRPGSSMSNQLMNSRSASNMSGRFGPGPRKPLPPLEDLTTLPTPSKLRDDSFALMGAVDFAPPSSFSERAAGRSQSPLGERRPYQVNVPVSSPLVSAFDEMAALPSPHLLRESSTFTGLDFAPPRKFKDPDTMSDAGSIRSNRSGISAMQQAAIRSGAGRVSRLPGDNVFTQAAMADQLKPNWGMRP